MEHERLSPFPHFAEAAADGYAIGNLALRPFGLYEADLDLDFDRTPRPVLITHLLERCTRSSRKESVEQNLFWNLPVGKRIECLVTLSTSGADGEMTFGFRCPNTICGEASEIALTIDELTTLQADAYATGRVEVPVGDEVLTLRRPTGNDQLAWLNRTFADGGEVRKTMIRTLLVHDNAGEAVGTDVGSDEWLDSIEEVMEEHDPLVNFKLKVKCPCCDGTTLVAIDLEELSLRGLRNAQLRLLAAVHRLAAHYHWSEREIFAVPAWRRAEYLSLIADERRQ
ncbi:MAG TPA: hypothetical protein VGN73_11900 [Gemmatimonadaceae bacterium]|nr:hypothetical protein [Gemmatimonadaceae bacterium]